MENEYLRVYAANARVVHSYIAKHGWAKAKGFFKKVIKGSVMLGYYDAEHLDAILDAMN